MIDVLPVLAEERLFGSIFFFLFVKPFADYTKAEFVEKRQISEEVTLDACIGAYYGYVLAFFKDREKN